MSILTSDAQARKDAPMARGLLDYFPLALAAVAELSRVSNEQHNPGEPMHWSREKSSDHADCIVRHLIDRGCFDSDGQRHSAKVAWRALAMLQLELEAAISLQDAPGQQQGATSKSESRVRPTQETVFPTRGIIDKWGAGVGLPLPHMAKTGSSRE